MISFITCLAFLLNMTSYDLAWSSIEKGRPVVTIKELNPATFSIPEYLGRIKDSWSAGLGQATVIHIQDAHCNYDAQKRIAEIIEYIRNDFGVSVINLEGGAKGYDLTAFTSITDKAKRETAADYFVKEGLMNGAEFYAINNPGKVSLWGIEDTELYIKNLNVYRRSLEHKDDIDTALRNLSYILSNLKIKIYSKPLLDLDLKYSQYKANNIEFKEYLGYMLEAAKSARGIDIKYFRDLDLLSRALHEESAIDFKRANNERDELVSILENKLSMNAITELVTKTAEFKAEKISQKAFYSYLMDKANMVRIDLKDMPELVKYINYISLYYAIDKVRVMEELELLYTKIMECYFENDGQRELARLSKNFAILKNIFNISLTRDDYRYYKANENAFDINNYSRFFDANAPKYGIEAKLDVNAADMDRYRDDISDFYEYSFKRDDAFVKNIRFAKNGRRATTGRPNASILVTGGFHTDNLCEMLKKEGISYISIIPNFTNPDGYECPYFKLLGGNPYAEYVKTAKSYGLSVMAIADPLNPIITDATRGLIAGDLYAGSGKDDVTPGALSPAPVSSQKRSASLGVRTVVSVSEGKVAVSAIDENGHVIPDTEIFVSEGETMTFEVRVAEGERAVLVEAPSRSDIAYAPGTYQTEVTVNDGVVSVQTYQVDEETQTRTEFGEPIIMSRHDPVAPIQKVVITGEIVPTTESDAARAYHEALARRTPPVTSEEEISPAAVPGTFKPEEYIKGVRKAATKVMANTNAQEEPIYIYIPADQDISGVPGSATHAIMQSVWAPEEDRLSRQYGYGKINLRFYDGTIEGLNTRIDGEGRALINARNTVVFMGADKIGDAKGLSEALGVTLIREKAPEEGSGYLSVGGHAILAIGVLKLLSEDTADSEYWIHVLNLVKALTNNPDKLKDVSRVDLVKMLTTGGLEIDLPPIKEIDVDGIRDIYKAEEASMQSV